MVRAMVTQWGMSDKLGPIRYGEREEMMFLNRQYSERRNYSDKVAQSIDEEVGRIVHEAHATCTLVLKENWAAMERVSRRLLETETVYAPEFEALMRGEENADGAGALPDSLTTPRLRPDTAVRTDDGSKRADSGPSLSGLPAPA
jgi:cell division protease FtsH